MQSIHLYNIHLDLFSPARFGFYLDPRDASVWSIQTSRLRESYKKANYHFTDKTCAIEYPRQELLFFSAYYEYLRKIFMDNRYRKAMT